MLSKNSLITMVDYTQKPISDIKIDDVVLGIMKNENHRSVYCESKVININKSFEKISNIIKLIIEKNEILLTKDQKLFLTCGSYSKNDFIYPLEGSDELYIFCYNEDMLGEHLYKIHGENQKLIYDLYGFNGFSNVEYDDFVYDLETETGNFIANNFILGD